MLRMTNGGGADESGKGKKRRRDKLLNVSDFLNQFQAHFLPSANKGVKSHVGKITARDLEDALEFRSLLEKLEILKEEQFVAEEFGKTEARSEPLTRQIAEWKTEQLEDLRKKMKNIPDRTKLIFSMLRRFEVWTSKIVAQDQLVTPTRLLPEAARSKTDQSSFCPFINIPPSSYFAEILPPITVKKNEELPLASTTAEAAGNDSSPSQESPISAFHRKNMLCGATLGLPPNKYTWEAYARLAIMASLITDDELSFRGCSESDSAKSRRELSLIKCLKSPSCLHDLNKRKGKNPSLGHNYSFSPKSDLVPLWIRSQRNTQALRQLILLFEVRKEKEISETIDSNDTLTEPQQASQDTSRNSTRIEGNHSMVDLSTNDSERGGTNKGDSVRFRATFRGNPEYVGPRVIDLCDDVDQLIEWAVLNQSIFTYRHIRKEILTAPLRRQQQSGRKRQRVTDDRQSDHGVISKRIFRDANEEGNLFELRQACQSYLLRWFARRNRNAMTILYSKRIENLPLDIGCLVNTKVVFEAKMLKKAGVPSKVQEYMQHLETGECYPEDRTLSRIDRRLFIKDRYDGTSPITCQTQVSNLLKSLSKACPENLMHRKNLIDAAVKDLEHLFQTFYPTTMDEDSQDDVYRAALKLVNPPQGCTESSIIDLLESTPAPWAEKCCESKKSGPDDLLTCFNCEQVFHNKSSRSGSSNCEYISLKDLVVSFPPLYDLFQLKRPTHLQYPDFTKSDNQWAKQAIQIEREMNDDGKLRRFGLSFYHTENCSKLLEIMETDAFSLLERINPREGYDVLVPTKISHKGCIIKEVHKDLCGGRAGLKIGDVIVGIEILKYAHAKDELKYGGARMFHFSDLSIEERLALLKVESLQLKLFIVRPPVDIVATANAWHNGIKRINKCILDVLRGLSEIKPWYCGGCIRSGTHNKSKSVFLEASYCRAVIRRVGMESYSEPFREGNQTSQSGCFCLRRLDSIMTHIMGVESKDTFYDLAPESFFDPSAMNSTSQRLPWATAELESRPMDLLCKAMKSLVDSEFPESRINTKRNALLRHFLLAFTSWCVGSTVKSKSHSQLIGPPKIFQYSRAPWLAATYPDSRSPSTTPEKTCKNHPSLRNGCPGAQQTGIIDREEVEKAGNSMNKYSMNASLVGKTFLVLPSDPLVEYVSKIVHIAHENRPIEFVIASYLPSEYHDEVVNGRKKDQYDQFDEKDGVYHLLPVVTSRQQNFLLERCRMRQKIANSSDSSWALLDVLNLDGVSRYSPTALRKKMKESSKIRLAIDHAIVREVCTPSPSLSPDIFEPLSSQYKFAVTESSSSPTDVDLEIQDKLLVTLLEGEVSLETVRELLDIDENHYQRGTAAGQQNRSNWEIIQREETSDALEFGSSCLNPGLVPINPVRASWKLFKLDHISEDEYTLYYSDFFFRDDASKQNLRKKLNPPHLLPFRGSQNKSLMVFTLFNGESEFAFTDSFGWGFEILKWKNERVLRVGRVRQDSLAYKVGLRTYDIIESINGVRVSRFESISSMICSLVGASNMKVRIPLNLSRTDELLILLSTITNAKIRLSPVTLFIFRPSSIDAPTDGPLPQPTIQLPQNNQLPQNKRTHPAQRNIGSDRGAVETASFSLRNGGISRPGTSVAHPYQRPVAVQRIIESNRRRMVELTGNGGQNRSLSSDNEGKQKISHLLRSLQLTQNSRKQVAEYMFYRPAKNGTILTILEVAIFLEALCNRTWKLGVRLLMPRYEISTIHEQIKIIFAWEPEAFVEIPIVRGRTYQHVLNLDFERMRCRQFPEIGPIILQEQKDGKTYRYRAPRRSLPIDRSIEKLFDRDKLQQQQWRSTQQLSSQPVNPSQSLAQNHNARHSHQNIYHGHNNNHQHERVHQNYGHYGSQISPHQPGNGGNYNRVNAPSTMNSHLRDVRYEQPQTQRTVEVQNNNNEVVDLVDADEENSGGFGSSLEIEEPSFLVRLDQQLCPQLDPQHLQRIRGGGSSDANEPNDPPPENESNYLYLCDVPREQWKGIAVFTFVQTTSNGSVCDDALLVGFANRCIQAHSSDEETPDQVEIEAYYLSGTGYFKKTKMHKADSDEVWVVNTEDDCEEARVIAKLGSQNRLPSDYQEHVQKTALRNIASDDYEEEDKEQRESEVLEREREEPEGERSRTATLGDQEALSRKESSIVAISCADALRLENDQIPYIYTCEEEPLGIKLPVEYHNGLHECSLCSLPFERYLVCNGPQERGKDGQKPTFYKSLGRSLMSHLALVEKPSPVDKTLPGRLGEGKTLLLKIARLVPDSLKVPAKDVRQQLDGPLRSFRIFDNDENYTIWKEFVTECICTDMLAQALVGLLASIQRSKLPDWWRRRDCGWSTPYATLAGSSLSALYLHIYVLDAALSDVLSRSLKEKSNRGNKSAEANAIQRQRMNNYWERAMALGYKAFKGNHNDNCYHCNDGGNLLCCELCPNVQHHECCDPPLTQDAKLDHWICDSCISDIDSYEEAEEEEYKDVEPEDTDDADEDFSLLD